MLPLFNIRTEEIHGAELATNCTQGGFFAYANLNVSRAVGKDATSGDFQFNLAELAYISTHDVYLDYDQHFTASAYTFYRSTTTSSTPAPFSAAVCQQLCQHRPAPVLHHGQTRHISKNLFER